MARLFLSATLILLAAFLLYSPTDNTSWDPSFYYAQLRAPLLDHDLNIEDEVTPPDGIQSRTARGRIPSPWPIAPGVLWSPFFVTAHITQLVRGAQSDGRSLLYYAFVAAGSALYGWAGLMATFRAAQWASQENRFLGKNGVAWLSAILVLGASPLFFYLLRQPVMAHATGFWATAFLLGALVLIESRQTPVRYSGLVVGTFLGIAIMLRRIGIVMAVIPILYGGYYLFLAWRTHDHTRLRQVVQQGGIALLATGIALLPQIAYYYQMFGTLGIHPVGDFGGSGLPVHLVNLLVGTNRGLLFWLPLALIGFIGILRLPSRALQVSLGGFVVVYLYGLGAWRDWYGGGGFGARYFIEILPIIGIGVAAFITPLVRSRWGQIVVIGVALFLLFHQLVLVVSAEQGWFPPEYGQGQPLPLTFQPDLMRRLVTEPNWWLAPRHSVLSERQSAIVTLVNGGRDPILFLFPAVAGAVWLGGGWLAWQSSHRRYILPATLALLLLMLWWGWRVLTIA
jgi:hypothetical protein